MGNNKGVILSVPRQHLYDWGKLIKMMSAIRSLVSFKWVLSNGRIRKRFYIFHIIITNRRGLAVCSILMVNPVLTNMQTSCKRPTSIAWHVYLVFCIHRSQSTAKQSESFYGWQNQVIEQWCDLPGLTLLPRHEEKFCFSPILYQIHWAPSLMGDQWTVVQMFSWHLPGGTIQNVVCVRLPCFQVGLN